MSLLAYSTHLFCLPKDCMNKLSLVAIATALSLLMLSTNVFAMDKPPVLNLDFNKVESNNIEKPPTLNLDFLLNYTVEIPPSLEINLSKINNPVILTPSVNSERILKRMPSTDAIRTNFYKN